MRGEVEHFSAERKWKRGCYTSRSQEEGETADAEGEGESENSVQEAKSGCSLGCFCRCAQRRSSGIPDGRGLAGAPLLLRPKLRAPIPRLLPPLGRFLGQHPSPALTIMNLGPWTSLKLPYWADT